MSIENLTPTEPDDFMLDNDALTRVFASRLQPETRRAVLACHAMHREMYGMEKPTALLGWVTIWIRDWELAEVDAAKILRASTDPERTMKFKNATELKQSLATMAMELIKRRESAMKAEGRRPPPINPENQAKAKEILHAYTESLK